MASKCKNAALSRSPGAPGRSDFGSRLEKSRVAGAEFFSRSGGEKNRSKPQNPPSLLSERAKRSSFTYPHLTQAHMTIACSVTNAKEEAEAEAHHSVVTSAVAARSF